MTDARQSHGTKERVGEAAAQLFARQGYVGTGLKQIAQVSGATFGSIYHFFPGGKSDLAEQAVRAAGPVYADVVKGVLGSVDDPAQALRTMFDTAAASLVASDYADACPIATLALEVASTDDRLRRATADVFELWVEDAAAWFGQWVDRPTSRELATSLVMLLEGGFLLARSARDPEPLHQAGRSMVTLFDAARRG